MKALKHRILKELKEINWKIEAGEAVFTDACLSRICYLAKAYHYLEKIPEDSGESPVESESSMSTTIL